MNAIKFKTAHTKIPRSQINFDQDKKQTESHHAESCDVNCIINRFKKTGVLEHRNTHRGTYGFASSQTFQDAMQIVAQGNSLFSELPSEIRDKFNHDPAQFLEFVQDEKNAPEMVELGLAKNLEDIASKTQQLSTVDVVDALRMVIKDPDGENVSKDVTEPSDKNGSKKAS